MIGLTKSVAMDFIKQGVRVNAICPGTIESPSFRDRVAAHSKRSGKSPKAALQDFIDRQPMGRIGTAEEVACSRSSSPATNPSSSPATPI